MFLHMFVDGIHLAYEGDHEGELLHQAETILNTKLTFRPADGTVYNHCKSHIPCGVLFSANYLVTKVKHELA